MRTTSIRDLHMRTGAIVDEAAKGKVIVIARRGKPVAEIRPIQRRTPSQMIKDLQPLLARLPKMKTDSTRFISEDRDRG